MRGGTRGGGGAGKIRRRGGPIPPPSGIINNMRLFNNGKLPFDLIFLEDVFPRVTPAPDDTPLSTVSIIFNSSSVYIWFGLGSNVHDFLKI